MRRHICLKFISESDDKVFEYEIANKIYYRAWSERW